VAPRRQRTPLTAFDAPIPSPADRRAAGKALRRAAARSTHAGWEPSADRFDPIEVLVESNRTRLQELIPLRYARMAVSPFAFLRGSALVMAHDLATTPTSGLTVQLCGDAHISNVGIFASPERRQMLDLNDFDETFPGPFEWDVKRMAASVTVAARERGCNTAGARALTMSCVTAYREWMARYSELTHLEVWYSKIDVREVLAQTSASVRRNTEAGLAKAASKDHMKALDKLTEVVDGRRRIVNDPPIVERWQDDDEVRERLEDVLTGYRESLPTERQMLFDRYRFVDFARKVVGVGSVGTRCFIALLQGPNGGPMFLQLKEARDAAPQVALGAKAPAHHGKRVVEGQRMLQAASDIMLGWATDSQTGIHYFVRQMWDQKGSFDIPTMRPEGFETYVWMCGWALAHAHARIADSATIAGYLGNSDTFATSVAGFAEAYADQTERDHAALRSAIDRGVITTDLI
jgi:uncharacterized protein (DUF2252 family)